MIVLAYLGSQCTTFHAAGWPCGFFTSFCLESCMRFRDGSGTGTASVHQLLCKSRKKCDRDPGNDRTSVRGRKHEPYTESPNSQRPKEMRQLKSKVKSMLKFSLKSGGLFTKYSSWHAKQSISHTTETFYGDCVKM
jgi:hypothetical protein